MNHLYYVGELMVYKDYKVGDSVVIEGTALSDEETKTLFKLTMRGNNAGSVPTMR